MINDNIYTVMSVIIGAYIQGPENYQAIFLLRMKDDAQDTPHDMVHHTQLPKVCVSLNWSLVDATLFCVYSYLFKGRRPENGLAGKTS